MDAQTLLTTGDIARRLNESPMMIRHIVASRGIAHCGIAAQTRVFPESAVDEVRAALANTTRRRRRKPVLS